MGPVFLKFGALPAGRPSEWRYLLESDKCQLGIPAPLVTMPVGMAAADRENTAAQALVGAEHPSVQFKAYLFLGSAILAAAATPIAIRFAQIEGVPSLAIIFIRLLLASTLMLPVILTRYRPALRALSPADWGWTIAAGASHIMGLVLLFFSLEFTTVLINSVLRQTSPLWVLVLEVLLLHTIFRRRVWLGVLLAITGTLVVGLTGVHETTAGRSDLIGGGLALLNAFFIAAYLILGRKLRGKIPFFAYSWVIFVTAAVIAGVVILATGTSLFGYSAAGYIWVIIITFSAQFMGHLAINASLHHFPATVLSVLMQSSVILSAVLAFFSLGELPTLWQITGSLIILGGVVLVTLRRRRPPPPPDPG